MGVKGTEATDAPDMNRARPDVNMSSVDAALMPTTAVLHVVTY